MQDAPATPALALRASAVPVLLAGARESAERGLPSSRPVYPQSSYNPRGIHSWGNHMKINQANFVRPHGTSSKVQGRLPDVAGSNGVCPWTWKIGTGTEPGTGTPMITADGQTRSFPIVIR